jgi:hypothetical protein
MSDLLPMMHFLVIIYNIHTGKPLTGEIILGLPLSTEPVDPKWAVQFLHSFFYLVCGGNKAVNIYTINHKIYNFC